MTGRIKMKFGLSTGLLALLMTSAPVYSISHTAVDKLAYHYDAQRTGWNDHEGVLTPEVVASSAFGLLWQSPQLDSFGDKPPRLFATPLYMHSVRMTDGAYKGKRFAVVYAVSTTGYAYAISAAASGSVPPGTILWRAQLTDTPCGKGTLGNYSTPVIDPTKNRIYLTSCHNEDLWQAHALDIGSGKSVSGWPVPITPEAIDGGKLNNNGSREFAGKRHTQRGALALSPDAERLYISFGPDPGGWLVALDTAQAKIASAFSSTASNDEDQGGMWASGGPSVDKQGRIHIATGANFGATMKKLGIPGIFPESYGSWGQSILQFRDDRTHGLTLTGTYTPFNYCHASSRDIDIGSSGAILIDLPPSSTSTPSLLVLGGKQGNFYLLDRDHMPGNTTRRQPCSTDPESDGSLLAPDPQPHFGLRGPINIFGPYSDYISMLDQAKSRTTAAYYRDADGGNYVFVTGSAKTGVDFSISEPPGLAKVKIVTAPGKPAYPEIAALEKTQTFLNPGSPVVTSNGAKGAIVWVLDINALRTAPLYGENPPQPILYAFAADDLTLLWKSAPGELFTSGKYNEPTVADGLVLVGTDRIQAYGLKRPSLETDKEAGFQPLFDGKTLTGWRGDNSFWSVVDGAITGKSDEAIPRNTFLVTEQSYGNFEIRLKYRFLTEKGNSGLQYRSRTVDGKDFEVTGYQANIATADAEDRFGMLYHELGRGVLALTGEKVEVRSMSGGVDRKILGRVNSLQDILEARRSYPEWNDYVVIAYGNHLVNAMNGHLLTDIVDLDPQSDKDGIIGFQLHAGSPMGIQFKDIRIKQLTSPPVLEGRFLSSIAKTAAAPAQKVRPAPSSPPRPAIAAASARSIANGREIFQSRCVTCHGSGQPGIPTEDHLAKLPQSKIIDTLLNGTMQLMAAGLSRDQVSDIAKYLTERK